MQKRSISLQGHRTSIALEVAFWDALDAAAAEDNVTVPQLVASIDRVRAKSNPMPSLASALRLYALHRLQGKRLAGPGEPV